jgi:hypothetical protein
MSQTRTKSQRKAGVCSGVRPLKEPVVSSEYFTAVRHILARPREFRLKNIHRCLAPAQKTRRPPFLFLPPEIRYMIYDEILSSKIVQLAQFNRTASNDALDCLAQTSHQVRDELKQWSTKNKKLRITREYGMIPVDSINIHADFNMDPWDASINLPLVAGAWGLHQRKLEILDSQHTNMRLECRIPDGKCLLTWLIFFLPMFDRTSNIKRIELVFSVPLEVRRLILANKYFEHYGRRLELRSGKGEGVLYHVLDTEEEASSP